MTLKPSDQFHIGIVVDLDQEGQTLGLLPVRVEVRIRLGPPVELEQVVREQPPESVAVVELCGPASRLG